MLEHKLISVKNLKTNFIITLNKYSSFKFPNKEKIKNITKLEIKHINKDKIYLV